MTDRDGLSLETIISFTNRGIDCWVQHGIVRWKVYIRLEIALIRSVLFL